MCRCRPPIAFPALADGKIDLLARNSTWTMGRETDLGLTFVGVTYYDGQGFLLPRSAGTFSSLELDGVEGLRPVGNDQRGQPRRLFQRQQHGL